MQKLVLFLMAIALCVATPAFAIDLGELAGTLKDDAIQRPVPTGADLAKCIAIMQQIQREAEGKIVYIRMPIHECPKGGKYEVTRDSGEVLVSCSVHGPLAGSALSLDPLRCKLAMRRAAEAKRRAILGTGPVYLKAGLGTVADGTTPAETAAGTTGVSVGIRMPVYACPADGGPYDIKVVYFKDRLSGLKKGTLEALLDGAKDEAAVGDDEPAADPTIRKGHFPSAQRGLILVTCKKHGTFKLPFNKKPAFDAARFRCGMNRSLLKRAVEAYLAEKDATEGLAVDLKTLVAEGYLKAEPKCPDLGNYTIKVTAAPICRTLPGTSEVQVGEADPAKLIGPMGHGRPRVAVTCSKHPAIDLKPLPWPKPLPKPRPKPLPFPLDLEKEKAL